MRPYGHVSACFSRFWGIGVGVGFGSRLRTGTEGSTNTENTPYGVFSVLVVFEGAGSENAKNIRNAPIWARFCVFFAFLENRGRGGLRLEARTGTEGSTNTENTPYGVFSVLEGERQGLGIV